MEALARISSRWQCRPFRTHDLDSPKIKPTLDENGHISFSPNDLENPKNWSATRRWLLTIISLLLVVNATFASSGPSAVLPSISQELHVSEEAAGLTVTLFLIANGAGPLFWAPLSEHYGRKWIFYGTFLGYIAFNFLCAFAPNFGALLVGRFLTGIFASSSNATAPGLLVDVWEPLDRGNAIAFFSVAVYVGPSLAPIVSGFLELKEDWRWSFYVLLWLAGGTLPFLFMIPETLPSRLLVAKARRLRSQNPDYRDIKAPVETTEQSLVSLYRVALIRPWRISIDPICMACTAYNSLVYALLYMLFAIYPIVFEQMRGWNAGVSELPLLGIAIGACIGGFVVLYMTSLERKKVATGYKRVPEDRLPLAMAGAILFPVSMFWFAWTAQYNSIHWIVPSLAGVFLAMSFLFITMAYLNYLADTYTAYAASAVAANTVWRSLCGAATPLFTTYMFRALTVAGGGSLIAGFGCLLAPVPFIFSKYGAEIRRRSKFASSMRDTLRG